MLCSRCRHENQAGAKFCEECATPLARACAKCGRPVSPTAKFCPECAHPTGLSTGAASAQRFDSPESHTPKHLAEKILASKAAIEGERKQVTVLFADVKGSLWSGAGIGHACRHHQGTSRHFLDPGGTDHGSTSRAEEGPVPGLPSPDLRETFTRRSTTDTILT